MTEKLKRIIDNSEKIEHGVFNEFLIIPSSKLYKGFWGENGFNTMIVLAGSYKKNDWKIVSNLSDTFNLIFSPDVNFDVPSDLECLRVFTSKPIEIFGGFSSVTGFAKG